jgi:hypothetical protein
LYAADLNAGPVQTVQRFGGVLVLDGEVAAVEADAHVIVQVLAGRLHTASHRCRKDRSARGEQPLLEKGDQLTARFNQAVGLRLDVEMNEFPRLPPQLHQCNRNAHDIADEHVPGFRGGFLHPWLVRQWHGRHAAVDAARQQTPEDLDQVQCVTDPRLVSPVRRVHVRLDDGAVERAVGEPVDERDVQACRVEEGAELAEMVSLQQFARIPRGEPKSNSERSRRREAGLESGRESPQVGVDLGPAVTRVDVRTVGQVKEAIVGQLHVWRSFVSRPVPGPVPLFRTRP